LEALLGNDLEALLRRSVDVVGSRLENPTNPPKRQNRDNLPHQGDDLPYDTGDLPYDVREPPV